MTAAQWLQREIERTWGVSCSIEMAGQLVGGVFIQAAYDRARHRDDDRARHQDVTLNPPSVTVGAEIPGSGR